mmetsp:Transcript_20496/g.58279  ORF Transcript_20496/g.58279 Transcript_20496/m.58279 type:complete len:133 (+) Transcript_20496:1691-2089(+)
MSHLCAAAGGDNAAGYVTGPNVANSQLTARSHTLLASLKHWQKNDCALAAPMAPLLTLNEGKGQLVTQGTVNFPSVMHGQKQGMIAHHKLATNSSSSNKKNRLGAGKLSHQKKLSWYLKSQLAPPAPGRPVL